MPLIGIAVATFRRSHNAIPDGPTEDAPLRLLRWTAGLLSEPRDEWGRAMLGELDRIEGLGPRWRFAIGCAGAALLMPPWGQAAAGLLAMIAVAIGSLGAYADAVIRFRLGIGDWVALAIAIAFLASLVVAAAVLLRRPGVAVPGVLGGLFVTLVWLAMTGFTFYGFIGPMATTRLALLLIAVPAVVGMTGTLWAGSAVVGRRTARLAAVSAGLFLFLYGTVAVAVLGAGGPPDDAGFTVRYIISDRLGNNILPNLMILPLVTATVGWAAAAATARIRPRLVADTDSVTFTTGGPEQPMTTRHAAGSPVVRRPRRRAVQGRAPMRPISGGRAPICGQLVKELTKPKVLLALGKLDATTAAICPASVTRRSGHEVRST
jgi:hypothetical protein